MAPKALAPRTQETMPLSSATQLLVDLHAESDNLMVVSIKPNISLTRQAKSF